MGSNPLDRPVFFVGMPRSGTTVIFEAFARHDKLAWLTNYSQKYPDKPWFNGIRRLHNNSIIKIHAKKKQYGKVNLFNNIMVKPAEAYDFWDAHSGVDFSRSCLRGAIASGDAKAVLRKMVGGTVASQGGERFSTKLTGPGRIEFLRSVFPDAIFIHVVRDGRAVVHSLSRVPFWKEKGGFDAPFWEGIFGEETERQWLESGKEPGLLTALQWEAVVRTIDEDTKTFQVPTMSVKYEDFVEAPHDLLQDMFSFAGLDDSDSAHAYIDAGIKLVNMNDKYKKDWSPEYIQGLTDAMGPSLRFYDYR